MDHASQPEGPWRRWGSTLPVLVLLVGTVLHWVSSGVSGRLIRIGGEIWPGYAIELRRDLPRPEPVTVAPAPAQTADDALIGDLLGDDPKPPSEGQADDALIDDLLGDAPAGDGQADDALIDDLLGDAPPPEPLPDGQADDALIGDLLGEPPTEAATPPPPTTDPLAEWSAIEARKTPGVRAFRAIEVALSDFTAWGNRQFGAILVLLVLFAGATATATRGHISLRPVRTRLDDRLSQGAQLLANLVLAASLVRLYQLNIASGTTLDHAEMPLLWAAAFALMALLNVGLLLRPPAHLTGEGAWSEALLTPPLYTGMALTSATWFVFGEQYLAGLGVYLQKLTEHGELYVFVGLYVWTGMLLKRTRIVHKGFDVLRPWKLPPDLLAVLIVAAAALPTAYSGASGIFVIATGGLVYAELRQVGARPQLALAATAMSGSLGVVLSPCLLVVIVAYLNPPTTDQLYGWGAWVYLLTAGLFGLVVYLTRQSPFTFAKPGVAGPASARALRPLLPYAVLGAITLALSIGILETGLDEHTAPMLLPLFLIGVLMWERRTPEPAPKPTALPPEGIWAATSETTVHMGALLLLMCLSIALGGVFERSDIMSLVPTDLGSVWVVMAMLVVVLVVVGMTMDPYGAVILVSATIASVAYRSGIDETHFWMVVLVAFELGYLTPPVALNHLLTRQVVGADAVAEARASTAHSDSFWRRHEQLLLPVTVMGTALLLVAFVPLFFYG